MKCKCKSHTACTTTRPALATSYAQAPATCTKDLPHARPTKQLLLPTVHPSYHSNDQGDHQQLLSTLLCKADRSPDSSCIAAGSHHSSQSSLESCCSSEKQQRHNLQAGRHERSPMRLRHHAVYTQLGCGFNKTSAYLPCPAITACSSQQLGSLKQPAACQGTSTALMRTRSLLM
jgi:hypothetical protein